MISNEALDNIAIFNEVIDSYTLENVEEEPGSGMRESQRLTLFFKSGKMLTINTFCSGSLENTFFDFDLKG